MSRSIFNRSFYKWVVWAFGALFMFYKFAIEVSPSVMTTHLMAAFQIDGTYLGNLAASYFYGYLLMQLPAGILVDRYGPRRVTTIAILFCSVGGLVFALSPHLWVASLGRLLMGLGAAFAAINCLKLTANWFPLKRFAFMAGLMMSIAMLGAVGGQAPLYKMIQALGWREAMLIISYSGFSLGILFFILIRNRAPKHRKIDIASEKGGIWGHCAAIFKSKQAWLLSVYSGLAFAPVTFFGGLWGVPFLMEKYHLSHALSAQAISMIFIGFGVGAPVAGWLSDMMGSRKKVMYFGTFASLLMSVVVIYVTVPVWVLNLFLFGFGFFVSGFLVCFTMIREISAPAVAATAIGFMNAFDALLGALSEPLTGWFLDLGWKGETLEGGRIFPVEAYQKALSTLPIYLTVAFIILFFIKETYKRDDVVPTPMP